MKKYKAQKLPDGSLRIFDLELLAPLKAGEKPNLKHDIGRDWMKMSLRNDAQMRAAGVKPRGWKGHNYKEKPAPVIAEIEESYFDESREMVVAKSVRVTDPESVEKFIRGEMPRRSAEFYADPPYIAGLAFGIDMGHQNASRQLPDIELQVLQLSQDATLIESEWQEGISLELSGEEDMLTPEMKAEIAKMITDAIAAAMKSDAPEAAPAAEAVALEQRIQDAVKLELEKLGDNTISDPANKKLVDKLSEKFRLELETYKDAADTDSKVMILLSQEGNQYTEGELRKMFKDDTVLKKYGNRAGLFEYLKLQNEAGNVKLNSELGIQHGTVAAERALAEEFDMNWPEGKGAPMTKLQYIAQNKDTYQMVHG